MDTVTSQKSVILKWYVSIQLNIEKHFNMPPTIQHSFHTT